MIVVSRQSGVVIGLVSVLVAPLAASPARAYWGGGYYGETYQPYYVPPPAYYYAPPRVVYPPPYYYAPPPMRAVHASRRLTPPASHPRTRPAAGCGPAVSGRHAATPASTVEPASTPARPVPAKPTFGSRPADVPQPDPATPATEQ